MDLGFGSAEVVVIVGLSVEGCRGFGFGGLGFRGSGLRVKGFRIGGLQFLELGFRV